MNNKGTKDFRVLKDFRDYRTDSYTPKVISGHSFSPTVSQLRNRDSIAKPEG